jgi:hypothetical protein
VSGLAAGQTLVHDAVFGVEPTAATRRVELRLDGKTVAVQTAAPFSFDWDPVDAAPGSHELELRARAWDGRTATAALQLEVEHPLASPAAAALLSGLST